MLSGKDLILATKPFAQDIPKKSWFYTLTTYALLIIVYLGIWYLPSYYVKFGLSIFCALVIVRLFVIYHDFLHHSILHHSTPAAILFAIFGVFILAPPSIWKRSHDYHHNHNSKLFTANIGSYPIMTVEKYTAASKGERFYYLFQRHPITILFGYLFAFAFGLSIKPSINCPTKHWDCILALIIHVALHIVVWKFAGPFMWLVLIIIPFFISCCIGAYLFYAQHNFPDAKFNDKENWSYGEAALISSSYMKLTPFWQWVTANIGFHHIHHMNSRIPFYRLPEAMEAIKEFQNPGLTSLKPKDIAACFRIKVWDEEKNAMVPLP